MFGAYEPGLMYQYFIDYITVIKAMFSYGKYWALGHVLVEANIVLLAGVL